MGSPKTFHLVPVEFLGSGPTFGRTKYDERPAGAFGDTSAPCFFLKRANPADSFFQCAGHLLMHHWRIVALHKNRIPSIA